MKKLKFITTILFCLLIGTAAIAQSKQQILMYVESMSKYAIQEMYRSGVPASISLAQGIIETSAGTSELYSRSFNNFGIKCKSNWNGKFTYHDDDTKGECFRVYENDSLSYVDHSNFLKGSSRYGFLFQLEATDYRSWAIGLKKAGYATNPAYPMMLIKNIEEFKLDEFDQTERYEKKVISSFPKSASIPHNNASTPKVNYSNKQLADVNTLNTKSKSTTNASTNNAAKSTAKATVTEEPAAVSNTDVDYTPVHWQTKNITDATPGYTHSPTGLVTKKTYKGGKSISYSKKKAPAKKGGVYNKKAPVKKPIAGAKKPIAKKAPVKKPIAKSAGKK
jgi:hypothetical protein